MTDSNKINRKAYKRSLELLLRTDWETTKRRVPKQGMAPVYNFLHDLAERWESNGDKIIAGKGCEECSVNHPNRWHPAKGKEAI